MEGEEEEELGFRLGSLCSLTALPLAQCLLRTPLTGMTCLMVQQRNWETA